MNGRLYYTYKPAAGGAVASFYEDSAYETHNTSDFSDLDVQKPSNISCTLWACEGCQKCVACYTDVNNIRMAYYQYFLHDDPNSFKVKRRCLVYSTDTNDIPNKICQQETGETAHQGRFRNH